MNVLVIDDNISLLKALIVFLKEEGCSAYSASCVAEGLSLLSKFEFDLVITDLKLPDGDGLEIIKAASQVVPKPEIILMTAFGSVDSAVEAMKLGVMDYLTKPVSIEEFAFRINRVREIKALEKSNTNLTKIKNRLLKDSGLLSPIDEILGESKFITDVKTLIQKVAEFPSTVLITGETGVGKELVARAVHSLSKSKDGPFVRVNCAAIPDSLFESELFGHEKGAFTDAKSKRTGYFEEAENGTIFLDEIGEIPIELQAKLLRALQEKEITRVGASKPMVINTRIVAATNRNLEKMVAEKTFRQDLLYRLSVVKIEIPTLRERKEDIPLLCKAIVQKLALELGKSDMSISDKAIAYLKSLEWPGNIRELNNSLERAIVLADSNILGLSDFGKSLGEDVGANSSLDFVMQPLSEKTLFSESGLKHENSDVGLIELLETIEKRAISKALTESKGVKSRAADILKIPRTQLLYRMKRLGIKN